jgi:hypothetical protein
MKLMHQMAENNRKLIPLFGDQRGNEIVGEEVRVTMKNVKRRVRRRRRIEEESP